MLHQLIGSPVRFCLIQCPTGKFIRFCFLQSLPCETDKIKTILHRIFHVAPLRTSIYRQWRMFHPCERRGSTSLMSTWEKYSDLPKHACLKKILLPLWSTLRVPFNQFSWCISLKLFKDLIHNETTNERHLNVKTDIFCMPFNRTMTFLFKILPTKLPSVFLQHFVGSVRKWDWKVILSQKKNQLYQPRMFGND